MIESSQKVLRSIFLVSLGLLLLGLQFHSSSLPILLFAIAHRSCCLLPGMRIDCPFGCTGTPSCRNGLKVSFLDFSSGGVGLERICVRSKIHGQQCSRRVL